MASGEERYQEFAPPPALRPFVRTIWTYAAPDPSPTIQRIAPDGCPELVFDLGAPYAEQGEDGLFRLQPPALFAGQMTRPLIMHPTGPTELVAVRFEPDGARDFLGLPLSTATDRRLDMVERLAGFAPPPADPEGQVAAFVTWLEDQRRRTAWRIDPVVRAEITAAEAEAPAPAPVSARAASAQRALQRRFADRVGVSPRLLRSIFRFRRVFDHAARPGEDVEGWLEAGLQAGYFDQPQMARDFRRFLGCTATDWARDQHALARAIASQARVAS
ncbi:MAG: helix-turn-helix domain-containing protein [Alphaproteobacteria bacterium]|uniref:AraC family transcriptional regulator n=1 Tax=Brevundimonas TaxID=41275 RepID=UPI000DB55FCA|nr:helix-turn-helix domain-containing protein [Brevundimonas sp.]MBU1272518.1 helix-turn-helix domain-containing protein [Alphaproteobacteria bacterium]MBJ7319929.1 helix-turn-helix domain-containing protein [Brevundimonas sp.]MBU1520695.1 helix-turn-helix domain-containing protein [Alphaproteobacteria bacterium]MBU2029324.1 helix-turn-helix domain-containing protein [Alphaproteobacteria bacterium]MBU2164210.1 helix-turn-helix domain-containing protein [Alphaproteobacteria bacterium]